MVCLCMTTIEAAPQTKLADFFKLKKPLDSQLLSEESKGSKLGQAQRVYETEIERNFDLLDRFLEGLRARVFSPNSLRCSQRVRIAALDVNSTLVNYKLAPKNTSP